MFTNLADDFHQKWCRLNAAIWDSFPYSSAQWYYIVNVIRDLESPLLVTDVCVWLPQLILSLGKNSSFQITNKNPVLQTFFKD